MERTHVPARDAFAQANLGHLLRVIYDGRRAIARQDELEEYADPERALLELARSETWEGGARGGMSRGDRGP